MLYELIAVVRIRITIMARCGMIANVPRNRCDQAPLMK